MGAALNRVSPPAPEVHPGSGDAGLHAMLVATRWEYGSRLNADGFEYRRFLPALKRTAGTVTFIPVEARHQIVRHIESFLRPGQTTVALSVFQGVQAIPPDYFQLAGHGVYLANWHTDDDMLFEPFSTRVADRFHLNITTYEPNLPRYEAIGAEAVASQWGGLAECMAGEVLSPSGCVVSLATRFSCMTPGSNQSATKP